MPLLHCPCLACAGPAPSSPCPCIVNAIVVSVPLPPPPLPTAAILLSSCHCCQCTSLASDVSSLAVLANADTDVMTVALGFNNADANTIIACSSAAAATQHCRCNLQLPPKATSQCHHTAAISQRHHCAAAMSQRSIHVDVVCYIFLLNARPCNRNFSQRCTVNDGAC
jgi:hypothetical protein